MKKFTTKERNEAAMKEDGFFDIYSREFFEGEEIKRNLLRKKLDRRTAVCILLDIFRETIKPWEEKFVMVQTGFASDGGYYFYAIPVDHDRCLRVEMVNVRTPLPEM